MSYQIISAKIYHIVMKDFVLGPRSNHEYTINYHSLDLPAETARVVETSTENIGLCYSDK